MVSAIFHYLGPAFAVLLFARVDVLGVAWLRIASAALIFAAVAPPVAQRGRRRAAAARLGRGAGGDERCFYLAIDRLPLGTVAAIEFLPVIVLAALGARTPRNLGALALAVPGRLPAHRRRARRRSAGRGLRLRQRRAVRRLHHGQPPAAQTARCRGSIGWAMAMLVAAVVATPIGVLGRGARLRRPGGARGRHRRRRLLLGHPLRDRSARDGADVALDLRAPWSRCCPPWRRSSASSCSPSSQRDRGARRRAGDRGRRGAPRRGDHRLGWFLSAVGVGWGQVSCLVVVLRPKGRTACGEANSAEGALGLVLRLGAVQSASIA